MKEETRRKKKIRILYRGQREPYDFVLLFSVLCLMAFGLIMLYSVTNYEDAAINGDSFATVKKQLIYAALGIVAMIVVSRFDYHFYLRIIVIVAVVVVALCAFTMFFGVELNGQRRWINLGPMSLQPSELAKPVLIMALARYLTTHYRPRKRSKNPVQLWYFFGGMAITGIMTAFVVKNNLSTGIIIMLIGFFMIYTASSTKWVYPGLVVGAVVGIFVLWKAGVIEGILNENRLLRIYAWLDPEKYEKSGYQILQSLYAVSSGGLFGRGLGTSIQKLGFLPEAQNDMIFAIICEELGLMGAFFTMILFVVLLTRLHHVAERAKDMCGFLIVVGVMVHLGIQTLFNIAVAANIMPNTGVTLPFISAGGTALMCTLAEIGLVLAVGTQSPMAEEEEETEE